MEMRCPIDPNAERHSVWEPGSLNELFLNLTTLRENKKYKPHILSSPIDSGDKDSSCNLGSWTMYFDNFLSHREADKLISIGSELGFEPNFDGMRIEEYSMRREPFASTWLNEAAAQDSTVKKIMSRLEQITNIPTGNVENIQVVKYDQGQVHNLHHDYIYYQAQRQPGVRILSLFLFLSDVEEGGENFFPNLNIKVAPKKGRALVWPLVLNENPNKRDEKMWYEVKLVKKGALYGANIFIHQRDFKGPNKNNCH
mmetsp:Transcript_28072/g.31063  ORF Transcript_28072/g.31063 Transcript_28072/m.31063 type:complete len:255 (+) Transcript_28072:462-1226(+)